MMILKTMKKLILCQINNVSQFFRIEKKNSKQSGEHFKITGSNFLVLNSTPTFSVFLKHQNDLLPRTPDAGNPRRKTPRIKKALPRHRRFHAQKIHRIPADLLERQHTSDGSSRRLVQNGRQILARNGKL